MKKIKKVLILENDSEFQGFPDVIKDFLEDNPKLEVDKWFWFGEDVRQNPIKSLERFASVKDDTMVLTYPSFVGHGNSFEGKLSVFAQLMKHNVKLKMTIIFYPDFYWYLVKWMHDGYDPRKKKADIEILKSVLQFHEIYTLKHHDVRRSHKEVDFKKLPRLTWSDLEKNYFQRKEVVRVKATGKEYPLMYIHINLDEPEKSSVSLDLNKNVYTNADDLKLSEIEKITNK
jgi:hypothetical protein